MTEDDWVKMIGGAFAFMEAPFAIHPNDKARAKEYRKLAKKAGLEWPDVKRHLTTYMDRKSMSSDAQAVQMGRAKKFFKGSFL